MLIYASIERGIRMTGTDVAEITCFSRTAIDTRTVTGNVLNPFAATARAEGSYRYGIGKRDGRVCTELYDTPVDRTVRWKCIRETYHSCGPGVRTQRI
jgi:hypothetical protein